MIEHLTDKPAIIFGNSSGAIIALEILIQYPKRVQMVVAHEPPVISLLPDAAKWLAFFDEVYDTYRKDGIPKAMRQFASGIAGKLHLRIVPHVKLPISSYLDWKELIDTKEENREVETWLVVEGYLNDPDFDRWYPLSAIMSLLLTPPPQPLTALKIPTMSMVALRGFGGDAFVEYVEVVYHRLPNVKKRFVEVDDSVYWMLSHPKEAAESICEWFDETLSW